MANNLQKFKGRLEEILNGSKKFKNGRLLILMSDLRNVYNIPLYHDESFNRKNPEVIKLYQKVSFARDFE